MGALKVLTTCDPTYIQLLSEANMEELSDAVVDFLDEICPHVTATTKSSTPVGSGTTSSSSEGKVVAALYEAATWADELVKEGKLYVVRVHKLETGVLSSHSTCMYHITTFTMSLLAFITMYVLLRKWGNLPCINGLLASIPLYSLDVVIIIRPQLGYLKMLFWPDKAGKTCSVNIPTQ